MKKSVRVLHLVGNMNRGGVETWLVSLLPHLLAEHIHCDFMVNESRTYDYSEIIKSHGSKLLVCNEYQNRLAFAWQFFKLLKAHGPYDFVHCHTNWFSGLEAFVAALSGVTQRIVHAHSDTSWSDSTAGLKRRSAIFVMDGLIRQFSTGGLATSERAGQSLLRRRWASSPEYKIHLSTSDIGKFSPREPDVALRASLGISEGAIVVGNVGRFVPAKNHAFLLHAFRELLRLEPNSFLVCIGNGPDKKAVRALGHKLGIEDRLKLVSTTNQVSNYVAGLFDLFVLPSLTEGLGIVAVEAQAAGIPTILSDGVPPEACVIPELVTVLSLAQSAQEWACVMAKMKPVASVENRRNWFRQVIESGFDPGVNAKNLASYYRTLGEGTPVG